MPEKLYDKESEIRKSLRVNNLTDEQLVTLYLNTRVDIYFEKLYDRYAQQVYRRCVSLVKDQYEAEDLTQEIFLKLLFRLNTFRADSKFSTWLYVVTSNQCLDFLRANKNRRSLPLDGFAEDHSFETIRYHYEERIDRQEIMEAALIMLSVKERRILMLKYEDNLAIEAIAQGLLVSSSAVKMRLMRSRETLRELFVCIRDSQARI